MTIYPVFLREEVFAGSIGLNLYSKSARQTYPALLGLVLRKWIAGKEEAFSVLMDVLRSIIEQ